MSLGTLTSKDLGAAFPASSCSGIIISRNGFTAFYSRLAIKMQLARQSDESGGMMMNVGA
jgi:hypothetical protein